jgi:TonB family protein
VKRVFVALVIAALIHAGILLFGGVFKLFLVPHKKVEKTITDVELIEEEVKKDDKKEKEDKKVEKAPEETPPDQMPDTKVLEEIDKSAAPKLEQFSLADLESALAGGEGGDFGGASAGFQSGVVGGSGIGGAGSGMDLLGGGGGMDGKPKVVTSVDPAVPPSVRKKGGTITVIIFVSEKGRVTRVEVEKSTDPLLEKATVEAVRKWVFEPGTRGGKKSPFKTRQTIRIPAAS